MIDTSEQLGPKTGEGYYFTRAIEIAGSSGVYKMVQGTTITVEENDGNTIRFQYSPDGSEEYILLELSLHTFSDCTALDSRKNLPMKSKRALELLDPKTAPNVRKSDQGEEALQRLKVAAHDELSQVIRHIYKLGCPTARPLC